MDRGIPKEPEAFEEHLLAAMSATEHSLDPEAKALCGILNIALASYYLGECRSLLTELMPWNRRQLRLCEELKAAEARGS